MDTFFGRKYLDMNDQTTGASSDDGFIFKNLNEIEIEKISCEQKWK